jgi:hypothetical protein
MKVDMTGSALVEELHIDPFNRARVGDCAAYGFKGMANSSEFLVVELVEV